MSDPERVTLTEAERAKWDVDPDQWPHTPPLDIYLALESEDDNVFWRMGMGHAQNLLDAALERIRELEVRAADKDAQRVAEREARLEAQRERDNALYEKGELAGLVGEADRAREQAERQVREIREGIEALRDFAAIRLPFLQGESAATTRGWIAALDEAAALSGVSGPTEAGDD